MAMIILLSSKKILVKTGYTTFIHMLLIKKMIKLHFSKVFLVINFLHNLFSESWETLPMGKIHSGIKTT